MLWRPLFTFKPSAPRARARVRMRAQAYCWECVDAPIAFAPLLRLTAWPAGLLTRAMPLPGKAAGPARTFSIFLLACALLVMPQFLWHGRSARTACPGDAKAAQRGSLHVDVPFYMYDDDVMTMAAAQRCKKWGACSREPATDLAFFRVMRDHPWRVRDPEAARVFIIPIPMETSILYGNKTCGGNHHDRMATAFRRLFAHPLYRKHNASHYLHCHQWSCFLGWAWRASVFSRELYKEGNLSNIMMGRYERYLTTATDCERYGSTFGICGPKSFNEQFPITGLYRQRWDMARCVITVPYHAEGSLRKLRPTFEEWSARNNTVFYHTRVAGSKWNATALRHAPVTSEFSKLPGVNVGFGLPQGQWAAAFEDSQFCLAIRGDTPTSHALYNAIKVGCVPVIISDMFGFVGQPFSTQLSWSLFTVSLPEQAFLADSVAVARFLWQMPAAQKRSLVLNVQRLAQPALLYEPGGEIGELILRQLAQDCLDP